MEKSVKINILGQEYFVKGEGNGEDISKVAEYVNGKIKEINDQGLGLSDKKTAILAAMNIASDYFQLCREHDELLEDIHRRSKALVKHIDSLFDKATLEEVGCLMVDQHGDKTTLKCEGKID